MGEQNCWECIHHDVCILFINARENMAPEAIRKFCIRYVNQRGAVQYFLDLAQQKEGE